MQDCVNKQTTAYLTIFTSHGAMEVVSTNIYNDVNNILCLRQLSCERQACKEYSVFRQLPHHTPSHDTGKQTAVCCHVHHRKQQQHGAGKPTSQPNHMPWKSLRFLMVVGDAEEHMEHT